MRRLAAHRRAYVVGHELSPAATWHAPSARAFASHSASRSSLAPCSDFLAVSPFDVTSSTALAWFKLSLEVVPGADPPVQQVDTGTGSWNKPIVVKNGRAGLPYLSPILYVSACCAVLCCALACCAVLWCHGVWCVVLRIGMLRCAALVAACCAVKRCAALGWPGQAELD